jgi:hypothetical protein
MRTQFLIDTTWCAAHDRGRRCGHRNGAANSWHSLSERNLRAAREWAERLRMYGPTTDGQRVIATRLVGPDPCRIEAAECSNMRRKIL